MLPDALSAATVELVWSTDFIAVFLIRLVLTVGFSVTAQRGVNALAAGALVLRVRAHGAVLLVAVILAFCKAVAAPFRRDAINLAGETGELQGRAGRRLPTGQLIFLEKDKVHRARTAGGSISFHYADVGAAPVILGTRVFLVFVHAQFCHSMDVSQQRDTSLDLGATHASGFLNALNHLLLPVNPIQVIAKNSESDWLQHVRIF